MIGCIGAAIVAIAAVAPVARASTVDTFTFTQSGYSSAGFNNDGALNGTFTGTVEADGFIEKSDLSAFSAVLSYTTDGGGDQIVSNYFYLDNIDLFSFLPAADGTNSSLDVHAVDSIGVGLCVGAAAAFGLCGEEGNAVGVLQPALVTDELPSVTLVSSVQTSPPPAPAPEPGTLFLCGLALLAAGLGHGRKRRRTCTDM